VALGIHHQFQGNKDRGSRGSHAGNRGCNCRSDQASSDGKMMVLSIRGPSPKFSSNSSNQGKPWSRREQGLTGLHYQAHGKMFPSSCNDTLPVRATMGSYTYNTSMVIGPPATWQVGQHVIFPLEDTAKHGQTRHKKLFTLENPSHTMG
jgi:hypothetical protein